MYSHCTACDKFIPKKLIKVHIKLHEKGETEIKTPADNTETNNNEKAKVMIFPKEIEFLT